MTNRIRRVEVIDHRPNREGRILVQYGVSAEVLLQDSGTTLKVILREPDAPGSAAPDRIL